jgi:hypothetical protein
MPLLLIVNHTNNVCRYMKPNSQQHCRVSQKSYTLVGFERGSFCSSRRCDGHCTTPPALLYVGMCVSTYIQQVWSEENVFFFYSNDRFFSALLRQRRTHRATRWVCEKNTQNTAQPTLSSTLMHNFYSGESSRKISAIFKNVFKSKPSPNRRKSAESGHPGGGLLSSCYQPPQASLVLPPFDIFISNFRLPRAASTDIYGWQYQSNPSPPQPIHMCLCRNIAPGKIMDFQSQPFFSNVDS